MSFKREGDDWCLLNNLKKQRVSNLLSLHIPEDEAILMRNGRYSCAVCPYRPVFDTISVLAIHRKGKKHLLALTKYIKKEAACSTTTTVDNTPKIHENVKIKLHTAKKNRFGRKRTLQVDNEESTKKRQESTLSSKDINNYLRKVEKKRDFTELVDKRRQFANLIDSTPKTVICESSEKEEKNEQKTKVEIVVKSEKREENEYYLKLRERGWCKNQDGDWEREDGVEFDSDDDEPQNYIQNQ